MTLQVANLDKKAVSIGISIEGVESGLNISKATKTVLTSSNPMDENSFSEPNKVPIHIVNFRSLFKLVMLSTCLSECLLLCEQYMCNDVFCTRRWCLRKV